MIYPTALVMHPDCGLHDTGWGHPEHQGRLPAIVQALYRDTPALLPVMLQREAVPVTMEDLLRVHSPAHLERVRQVVHDAAVAGRTVPVDDDTMVSAASWDAALAAAGCVATALDLVLDGEAGSAFAAARPPGHHATPDRPMGFCLFNNVAVGVRRAQATRGLGRVLIIDWDVHHGNGTQDVFYDDPSVYFLSLHLSPHYPGTGAAGERGEGAGLGTTRNVEVSAGTDGATYRRLLADALDSTLDEFAPELVVVSAGFDCLDGDPLGGLRLEPEDLHDAMVLIRERTRPTADGRVVGVLEGGYVPKRVGRGVVQVVRALADLPPLD